MLLVHTLHYELHNRSVWLVAVVSCITVDWCVVSIIISATEAAPSTKTWNDIQIKVHLI